MWLVIIMLHFRERTWIYTYISFLKKAILMCMKWYLIVVFIYISPMTSFVEHLIILLWFLSAIVCLLWRNVYFKCFVHFQIGLFFAVEFEEFSTYMDTNLLLDMWFIKKKVQFYCCLYCYCWYCWLHIISF